MQPEHVAGERRPVTALFIDVVGSTAIAESMDPEDWAATMERALGIMYGAIERYEGWIANHTGDGCMALFGLPTAHEDDPARAVNAAIEMIDDLSAVTEALERDGVDFQVRVGINTGEVVARDVGGAAGDSRIYGDTLNVAARMQGEAQPGGILFTAETHRRVSDMFESRHVGAVSVKGKSEPIEAYEVVRRTGVRRQERGVAGLSSPMVGRDAELGQLVSALVPVRAGVGRAARIVGEPGIGKSRLLQELRAVASEDGFGWVEAGTVSYGRNLPLHLAIDLVRDLLGLPDPIESISGAEVRARLVSRSGELLGLEVSETIPVLVHLLGLPRDDADDRFLAHLEPRTLQLRYGEAIASLIRATAAERPLIVVCDDVHWADDASVDLLASLAATVQASPVLWVLASRPDRDVPGRRLLVAAEEAFGEALLALRLNPLAPGDGQVLVANLLEIDSLPEATRRTIIERAAGNPFFVEEIIRTLIDHDAITLVHGRWVATERASAVAIPESLHGLLLARIDRLPTDARHLLRVASVIGRTFGLSVLERVTGRGIPDTNEAHGHGGELALLEGAGLISLAASTPELEYTFRHALIGDAAYASLLRQQRQTLHSQAGEALLALYPERREELSPVLAHHFEQADDRERALEYLALAAHHARARFAKHEAVDLAGRALAQIPDEGAGDTERELRIELRLLQGSEGAAFVPRDDSIRILESVIAEADELGDPASSARAWIIIGQVRAQSGEQYSSSPELAAALERAISLADESGSAELRSRAQLAVAQTRYTASEFPAAIESFEQAIPVLIEEEQLLDASIAAGQVGTAYGHVGDFDSAARWTDRAYELGVESGDPNASLDADLSRGIIEGIRGDSVAAIEYARKAAEVARRVDNKACALVAYNVIGEQHLREGDKEEAAIALEAGAELATYCQFMPVKVEQTELLLQTARAGGGVGAREFERYERIIDLAGEVGDRLAEAELYEQRARDRISVGQSANAGEDLARAATLFAELGAAADRQRVDALQAELAATSGS